MFKKVLVLLFALFFTVGASFAAVGSIDYDKIIANYAKARAAVKEVDDRATELQRYVMDKEIEFKKIESPVQKRAFEEKIAKEFAQKQEALAKLKVQKETAIDKEVETAVKAVAIENKLEAVYDARMMFYGGVDITEKVIQKLNLKP